MSGPAATTCSKLSRTSRTCWPRRAASARASTAVRVALSTRPRVAGDRRRDEGRVADRRRARRTRRRPGRRRRPSAATCSDSRVLPVPPGPVSVRSRVCAAARPPRRARARGRRSVVSWVGRLLGRASSERERREVGGRPSASSWTSRSGGARSFSRCSPEVAQRDAVGSASPTRARVASESRTCPPWAAAAIRAARLMASPTTSSPASSASPVWRPIRTRTGAPSGQASAARARWAARRGRDRPLGAGEDHEEGVAFRALLVAVALGEGRPQHLPVPLADGPIRTRAELDLEARDPFDVGEEARDEAGRWTTGSGHGTGRPAVSGGRLRSARGAERRARAAAPGRPSAARA